MKYICSIILIVLTANIYSQETTKELAIQAVKETGLTEKWDKITEQIRKQILVHKLVNAGKGGENNIKYLEKHLNGDLILDIYTDEMIKEFTNEDLRELIKFYKSPVAKKVGIFEKTTNEKLDKLLKAKVDIITQEAMKIE